MTTSKEIERMAEEYAAKHCLAGGKLYDGVKAEYVMTNGNRTKYQMHSCTVLSVNVVISYV